MPKRFAVHDMNGQLITEAEIEPGVGSALWRCAGVTPGAYLLSAYDGTGILIATAPILKE
jgi:hypothetical protein